MRHARALPVESPAADLAADVDDVVFSPVFLDQSGQQIDRIAFRHGVEVQLHARIVLHQPPSLDTDLFAAHEFEDRIDVRVFDALPAGEAPRLDQRLDGHVVTPSLNAPMLSARCRLKAI